MLNKHSKEANEEGCDAYCCRGKLEKKSGKLQVVGEVLDKHGGGEELREEVADGDEKGEKQSGESEGDDDFKSQKLNEGGEKGFLISGFEMLIKCIGDGGKEEECSSGA